MKNLQRLGRNLMQKSDACWKKFLAPGGRLTSIYTGTGYAIFWAAFFRQKINFRGSFLARLYMVINFGVSFSKTTIQGNMPFIHPVHSMNDSLTSYTNILWYINFWRRVFGKFINFRVWLHTLKWHTPVICLLKLPPGSGYMSRHSPPNVPLFSDAHVWTKTTTLI